MASSVAGTSHARAARGAALGLMMGHGSEFTTYEHYVHSLDLLLFMACTHPAYAGRTGMARDRLASDRAEMRSLLGRTVSFRLPGKDLFDAIPRIARAYRDEVTELCPGKPQRGAPVAVPQRAATLFPLLSALLQVDESAPGHPAGQAQRDTAAALFVRFEVAWGKNRALFGSVLARWLAARIKSEGWASMSATDTLTWVSDVQALGAGIQLEVQRVARDVAGDVKQIHRVTQPFDRRFYRSGAARYWVRFADVRGRKLRRREVELRARHSRTQGSVTWLVEALHKASTRPCEARP